MKRRGVKDTDPYDWEKLESAGHSSSNNISSQNMASNIQSHIQVKTDGIHGGTGAIASTGNATTLGATNVSALEYVSVRIGDSTTRMRCRPRPPLHYSMCFDSRTLPDPSGQELQRNKLHAEQSAEQHPCHKPHAIEWCVDDFLVCLLLTCAEYVECIYWSIYPELYTAEDTPSEQKCKQNQQQPVMERRIKHIGLVQLFDASAHTSQRSSAVSVIRKPAHPIAICVQHVFNEIRYSIVAACLAA